MLGVAMCCHVLLVQLLIRFPPGGERRVSFVCGLGEPLGDMKTWRWESLVSESPWAAIHYYSLLNTKDL